MENILINTKNLDTNEPHRVNIELKNDAVQPQFKSRIWLKSCSIPLLQYVINSKNNTVVFQINNTATDITATITPGNYDPGELASELSDKLTSASSNTHVVSYDSITNKFSVSTDGTNLRLMPSSTGAYELGIGETVQSFASPFEHPNQLRLDGTDYLDIRSTGFGSSSYNTNSSTSTIERIPATTSSGVLFYIPDNPVKHRIPNNFSNFDLVLFDDKNQVYELPREGYVSYHFVLE